MSINEIYSHAQLRIKGSFSKARRFAKLLLVGGNYCVVGLIKLLIKLFKKRNLLAKAIKKIDI